MLPVLYFVLVAYPLLNEEVEARRTLLPVYDISRQLEREIARADRSSRELPPTYASIIADYGELPSNGKLKELADLSASVRQRDLAERGLATLILWTKKMPPDFLAADPVREIVANVRDLLRKEHRSDAARKRIISNSVLEYLKYEPPRSDTVERVTFGFPPGMLGNGFVFCGERVPLERTDVRRRINYQISHYQHLSLCSDRFCSCHLNSPLLRLQ